MTDVTQNADPATQDEVPGEKETNKAPSPKPDQEDSQEIAPPLITSSKGRPYSKPHQPS